MTFDYEYIGGGWFRKRGVPKGVVADMLHGDHAIEEAVKQATAALEQEIAGLRKTIADQLTHEAERAGLKY